MTHLSPSNAALEINRLVNSKDSEIKLGANGGNAILATCRPAEEAAYIDEFINLSSTQYQMLDLNQVLVKFVETNRENIEFYFQESSGSLDQIFRNTITSEPDFFHLLLDEISKVYDQNKVPVIVNTGVIYASHFDILAIMESKVIMNAKLPTVFLYPSERDINGQLRFLNSRIASEYRCKII